MTETKRLNQLFKDLFDGDPWLDVNILHTLEAIDARLAARRIAEGRNTIWEIVNHLNSWRRNILDRIRGIYVPSPEHNYILPVEDTSEEAWRATLDELKTTQEDWLRVLKDFREGDLEKTGTDKNKTPYYYYVHGILQHDAYHLGQIVLLTKLQEKEVG